MKRGREKSLSLRNVGLYENSFPDQICTNLQNKRFQNLGQNSSETEQNLTESPYKNKTSNWVFIIICFIVALNLIDFILILFSWI